MSSALAHDGQVRVWSQRTMWRWLELGADDYLPKPFDFGELIARIRALGRRGPGSPAVVQRGDLVVDRCDEPLLGDLEVDGGGFGRPGVRPGRACTCG